MGETMKLKWVVKDLLQNQYELINAENGRAIAGIQGYYKGEGITSYQGFFLDSDPCSCTAYSDDLQKTMWLTEEMIERKCEEILENIDIVPRFDPKGSG